jgi:phosphohistidine phosphatase SixA
MKSLAFMVVLGIFLNMRPQARAADLANIILSLKDGGHVIVLRHFATDESQKDVYPFRFDDMTAQRQLSEKGRETAREVGAAIKKLGVPIGEIYTSKLNRAVETGRLMTGEDVSPLEALSDSGAGSASAMALRDLVAAPPKAGANNLVITHKTNIADAFGKDLSDVREGEALIYKPSPSGPSVSITRVQASEWIAQASK